MLVELSVMEQRYQAASNTRKSLIEPTAEKQAPVAQPPRVTFLELFFDLVFVVVIAQLAQRLAANPSWAGVGWFVYLFYAVWSSWINGTLYYDLHGTSSCPSSDFGSGRDP